ncbi:FtsK/SpoIIIE domain-containing protein [Pseudonocardia halophobica]|uniref:FtsK/SpoIIIE domain-containing protein n=1 Tax=Pseudonocardia halophobica TaxID=29401 RepID=UPI003D8D6432
MSGFLTAVGLWVALLVVWCALGRLRGVVRAGRRARSWVPAQGVRLAEAWQRAAEGAGLVRTVPTVTGPTVIAPAVVGVSLGPPTVLKVALEPGMTVADVRAVAGRLAPHLGVFGVRVEPVGVGAEVAVTLLRSDPLAGIPRPRLAPDAFAVELGRDELGDRVELELEAAAHLIVQGATRSGKSTGLYRVLARLGRLPHVRVTGCDPTGLLLAPWLARSGPIAPSVGTGDPAAHVRVLDALVVEMDKRVAAIPAGRDAVILGEGCPLLVVVLEEWPGLLRLLDGADKTAGKQARALVARLLAEGAKAGVRVVIVTQRAEAAIVGGFERGQASHRLSFRVDTADAVRMLHPDVDPDVIAAHATAEAGVCLLTAPGRPLTRLRTRPMPYSAYVAAVTGTGGGTR